MKPVLFFGLCCLGAASAGAAEIKRADDTRPIIAQMLHNPGAYMKKQVVIYGLVIERETPSTFSLQDVSQRPLKVIGKRGIRVSVGDQVTVRGALDKDKSGSYVFVARSLTETRVLGGGGCC